MMNKRRMLRLISLGMLLAAVAFVAVALANPQLGRTIYIGRLALNWKFWRACYGVYVLVMAGLFVSSFFVRDQKR